MKYSIILCFILLFTSCQSEQKTNGPIGKQDHLSQKNRSLQAVGTKNYLLPPRISSGYSHVQFITRHDSLLLLSLHKSNTAILVHDHKSGKWIETWKFEDDGPNKLYQMRSFAYHNQDSIFFLCGQAQDRISMANRRGTVKSNFYVFGREFGNELEPIYIIAQSSNRLYFDNDKLDFGLYFPGLPNDITPPKNHQAFSSYNIRDRKRNEFKIEYPSCYFENKYVYGYHFPIRVRIDKEHWLVGFQATSEVFICDRKGHILKQAFVPSDHLPKIIDGFSQNPGHRDKAKLLHGSYEIIQYDPWRSVFYRLTWLPCDNTDQDGNLLSTSDIPSSIIIFDMNLQKLGEFMIPNDIYIAGKMFAAPEGLLISNHHRNNESHKEDEMSFTVFELVEK